MTIEDLPGTIEQDLEQVSTAITNLTRFEEYGDPDSSRRTYEDSLEHYLIQAYEKLVVAFEILGLVNSLDGIRARWEKCVAKGLRHYTVEHNDEGEMFLEVPAVAFVMTAASTLEVAIRNERIKEQREVSQRNEQHAHERLTREEQHAHERRTLRINSTLGIVTVLLSLAFGNCERISGMIGSEEPPRASIVLSGAIASPAGADDRLLEVKCEPIIDGVFAAVGGDRYTLTIFPQVPLPLDLFCRGVSPGMQSDSVIVSIPQHPPRHGRLPIGNFAPTISLTASSSTAPPPAAPSQ